MSAIISRQQVQSRGYTLKEEYKQMAHDYLRENLSLKQELEHANKIIGNLYDRIRQQEDFINDWSEAYNQLESTHTTVVERHKLKVNKIKNQARHNPWPWVFSAFMLVVGLLVGMAI